MKRSPPRIDENTVYAAATRHHNNGQLQEAKNLYRAILSQNQRHAPSIFGMGTMAMQVAQYDKAVDFIRQAIKIGPATPLMYINLGSAYRHLEKYDEAIAAHNRALKLDKKNPAAFYNKGRALQALEKYAEARTCYERALELRDTDADAWANLGTTQLETGDPDLALYSFETAARLGPELGAPYSNAAAVFFDRGMYEVAITLVDKAISIEPENTEFRNRLSGFLLASGDLERGWKDFDLRFIENDKCKVYHRPQPPAYWNGESLKDKKILVWTEQGFGEEILGAGCIPDIIKSGAICTVECSQRMVPVLQSTFPEISIGHWAEHHIKAQEENTRPPFDFQAPALSLMKFFRSTMESMHGHMPIIKPNRASRDKLRSRYEELAGGKKIIGVSWQSHNQRFGHKKSIELEALEPILRTKNVFWVNLQYGEYAEDLANLKQRHGIEIYDDETVDSFGELDPVLSQIAAMDLVISISNSNVHFAGSMGIPAWMMIPKGRGQIWFWFREGEDSPWYPSVRIFRQKSGFVGEEDSSWPEVIEEVSTALQDWLATAQP